MTAGQLYPLPRRVALSAGLTLVRWARRPPNRAEERTVAQTATDRSRAVLRYRTAREVAARRDRELHQLLSHPRYL